MGIGDGVTIVGARERARTLALKWGCNFYSASFEGASSTFELRSLYLLQTARFTAGNSFLNPPHPAPGCQVPGQGLREFVVF